MKRFMTLVAGVAAAILLAGAGYAAPQVIVSEAYAQLPETHSQKLEALMVSPQSDSSDRTFDVLVRVDAALRDTQAHVNDLRKVLVSSSNSDIQNELKQYVAVHEELGTLRADAVALQKNIGKSIALWSKAENAAAQGKTINRDDFAKLNTLASKSRVALQSLKKTGEKLTAQSTALKNPRLEQLAAFLSGEGKALTKVVDLSAETNPTHRTAEDKTSSTSKVEKTSSMGESTVEGATVEGVAY